MRLMAAETLTTDCDSGASDVQWRQLVTKKPRRYTDGCHFLCYASNGHGHDTRALEDAIEGR